MSEKKKVIVVDDLQELRELMTFELEKSGFEVREAEHGQHALEVMQDFKCDMIVSDVRMPICNGIEFLKRVRKCYGNHPPVLFVSAFSDITIEEAFDLGVNGFMLKPFEPSELVRLVTRFCEPTRVRLGDNLSTPKPTAKVEGQFVSLGHTTSKDIVTVGNGGIFVPAKNSSLKIGCVVDIHLDFSEGSLPSLNCQGQVQWTRQEDDERKIAGAAIELFNLKDDELNHFETLANKAVRYLPTGNCDLVDPKQKAG